MEEKRSEKKVAVERRKPSDVGLNKHMENFVAAIKSRKHESLNCPIETGSHIATVCQLGNIAFRTGKKLNWDKQKGQFTDQKVNDEYMLKQYHNGYVLPKV